VSTAAAAQRPARTGRGIGLWLAFLIIIAAGIGLAWYGAGSLRPEVTASGLQFRTIKAGSGEPIGSNDASLMDYVLTVNGQVVDTSQNHGGPQPFAMASVFPGFAEAMTKMQEGGLYRFTMPARLAFGTGPTPKGFPGGDLTFEVQVRKVVRGGAQLMGGPPPNPPQ
jgi:FKBP-type peptidyl-prolyl cis-trans isomerase FkpA